MVKYELVNCNKYGLYQIKALKDFGTVKAGDLGGWIKSEDNLSQEGDAWIHQGAMVSGRARISGDAIVLSNAIISGNSQISGEAIIGEYAKVCGDIEICNVKVDGGINIEHKADLYGDITISSPSDYLVFKSRFTSFKHFIPYYTYTFPNDSWSIGILHMTSKELKEHLNEGSSFSSLEKEELKLYLELVDNLRELQES